MKVEAEEPSSREQLAAPFSATLAARIGPPKRSLPKGGATQNRLKALVRLRWIALFCQLVLVVGVSSLMQVALPLFGILSILGLTALTNLGLAAGARRVNQEVLIERLCGATVLLDVILLTGLLAFTGGPSNPFSVLYLVHVMLAAIITGSSWTWLVVLTSSAGFGLLFFYHWPLPEELGGHGHHTEVLWQEEAPPPSSPALASGESARHHEHHEHHPGAAARTGSVEHQAERSSQSAEPQLDANFSEGNNVTGASDGSPVRLLKLQTSQPFSLHLQGMWIAFTIAAFTIATFVSRLAASLRFEREQRERSSQLLGLATLAAGAAHEIGNPLGSIRIAASELEQDLADAALPSSVLDDLRLINREVGRAHQVLERMAIGAGELVGESPVPIELDELFQGVGRQLGSNARFVKVERITQISSVRWPLQASSQALTQLLRNAVQASLMNPVNRSLLEPAVGSERLAEPRGADGVSIGFFGGGGAPELASGETSRPLVRCEISHEADDIRIVIADSGVGMSSQVLARVGEPFFTTRSEGMGLGVFIARSLVEHLGGSLGFESSSGKGTRVTILIPRGVGL